MGEIRIVSPGKTRGYPYPVCKKEISSTAKKYKVCIKGKKDLFPILFVQAVIIPFCDKYFNQSNCMNSCGFREIQ